jgi:hypothetical protein
VTGWSLRNASAKRPSVVRTEEWTLAFWRADIEPELYHRPSDPLERSNVYRANKAVARELHAKYIAFLRAQETPLPNLIPRLWQVPISSPAKPVLAPDPQS